jgi:methyl-accepting chemotaxis protein
MTTDSEAYQTFQQQLDQLVQISMHQDQKLEIVTDQVGRLTEGLTELKLLIQQQAETARQQAESIDRLSRIAERQAETADRLATTVDRLIQERQS